MDRGQGIELVEYVGSLWQDYTFSREETALWCEKLHPYELGIAKKAIGDYKASKQGHYKSPKLDEVMSYCTRLQQAKHMQEIGGKPGDPVLAYSLKCIENARNPKAEGRLVNFHLSSGRNIPAFELVKQEAEGMAERFNRAYESTWVPVYGEIFSEETEDLPF